MEPTHPRASCVAPLHRARPSAVCPACAQSPCGHADPSQRGRVAGRHHTSDGLPLGRSRCGGACGAGGPRCAHVSGISGLRGHCVSGGPALRRRGRHACASCGHGACHDRWCGQAPSGGQPQHCATFASVCPPLASHSHTAGSASAAQTGVPGTVDNSNCSSRCRRDPSADGPRSCHSKGLALVSRHLLEDCHRDQGQRRLPSRPAGPPPSPQRHASATRRAPL